MQSLNKIFTVSELTHEIKTLLEPKFSLVQVKGEITNLRQQSSGHIYFNLKDAGALISAVLFKGNAKNLSAIPKDGDEIIVKGQLSIYPPKGGYQLIVRELSHAGVGELLLKLHQLKEELRQRGWFDHERKKILPLFPKTIGVVTSSTGSVIQDILNILTRRFSGFHLILYPVRVQGEEAAGEIAEAIYAFNRYRLADVLIVGRGGGSLQDLWPFNERIVAQAVFDSKIPIISAVGHETDFTLCDFVADVRAPTPSAAAEIVLAEKNAQMEFLNRSERQIRSLLNEKMHHLKSKLHNVEKNPFFRSPYLLLGMSIQKVDDLTETLSKNIEFFLSQKKLCIETAKKQLTTLNPLLKLQQKRESLLKLAEHLKSINPKNLLTKGYCIPFAENSNSVILSTEELQLGQMVRLLFQDGDAIAEIREIYGKR